VWQLPRGRWTGAVRFVADADILALGFVPRAGVLAAGDRSGRAHFLKVEPLRVGVVVLFKIWR
jgi:hypothetical protein